MGCRRGDWSMPSPIAVCFEAGRGGFWLHRLLMARDMRAVFPSLTR
jgi:hypothetical protein